MSTISERTQGTINYPDGTIARWDFIEHVPYDPACYQNDEGIVVFVPSYHGSTDHGVEYYISLTDASVWRMSEDGPPEQVEGAVCPEIKKDIDDFIARMGS